MVVVFNYLFGNVVEMNEVIEIRKINLKKLEAKYGSQVALAEILDTSTARVNHLLTGQRNIGEKTARKFEILLGKPSGWMDTLDSIAQSPSSPLLDKFNQLCPDQQREVTEFIDFKLSQKPANKPLTDQPEKCGGGGGVNLHDPLSAYKRRQNQAADKPFCDAVKRDIEDSQKKDAVTKEDYGSTLT